MHIANDFGEANMTAAVVDGETPSEERDVILAKFAAGAIQIIVNVGVFTEGFDCPDVGCIILARPTSTRPPRPTWRKATNAPIDARDPKPSVALTAAVS